MAPSQRWRGAFRTLSALGLLLSVPAILAAIYVLTPTSFQNTLALDHTAPELHAVWTNALVHDHRPGDGHLLGNIVGYSLLAFPAWLLYDTLDRTRRFWAAFVIVLALTPIVATVAGYTVYSVILDLRFDNARGFSSVVGALEGFLIVSILHTFADRQDSEVAVLSIGLYASVLFGGLGLFTARPEAVFLGAFVLLLTLLGIETSFVSRPGQLIAWARNTVPLSKILFVAVVTSVAVFPLLVPSDVTGSTGGRINIVSHGAGIVFGLLVEPGVRAFS